MPPQIYRLVKFIVQRRQIGVAIRNSFLTTCIENLEPLLLQRSHSHGAQPCTEPLELGQSLEHVVELLDVDAGNRDSLPRLDLDKTRSTQSPQSFADRSSRHSELPADARLVEPRTRLHLPGQNVLHECMEDFVRQSHDSPPLPACELTSAYTSEGYRAPDRYRPPLSRHA